MTVVKAVRMELSAGGVIYRRRSDGEVEVLLIRDSYGNWGFPKGHVEGTEDAWDAALRECREETGLSHLRLGDALAATDWYFRVGDTLVHKYCDYFLLEADASDVPRPQNVEGIQAVEWLSPEAALSRITYANARHVLGLALSSPGLRSAVEAEQRADTPPRPPARGK
jgi:8-oxo-dGTP pyrophosphatase MutT (NUDIX family)